MRARAVLLVIGLVAGGCTSGGGGEVDGEGLDQSGVYAAAIDAFVDVGGKELIYVAGPSWEPWSQWCNVETGEPGEPPLDQNEAACAARDASPVAPPPVYPPGSPEAQEIEEALAPAEVEFIEDPQSVIEPFEEGMMVAPIQSDAGLITFGVPIEADGKPIGTLGTVEGDKALAIVRIDRVADAMAENLTMTADGVAVSLALPEWSGLAFEKQSGEN